METAFSVLAIGVGIATVVGFAIFILRLVDRITLGPSMTPKELAEYERQFQKRLLQPQWSELEDHFGFKMPRSLRELYSDHNRLVRNSFYVVPPHSTDPDNHRFIARFEPADRQTLRCRLLWSTGVGNSSEVNGLDWCRGGLDHSACLNQQMCVSECPEVFQIFPVASVASVKPGANKYYQTYDRDIRSAVVCCPMACIHVKAPEDLNRVLYFRSSPRQAICSSLSFNNRFCRGE
jgi:ferredoxin